MRRVFITAEITNKTTTGVDDNSTYSGWNEEEHEESAEFMLNELHKLYEIQFDDPIDSDEESN